MVYFDCILRIFHYSTLFLGILKCIMKIQVYFYMFACKDCTNIDKKAHNFAFEIESYVIAVVYFTLVASNKQFSGIYSVCIYC